MDRQTWLDAEHDAKKSETKGKMEHVLAMDGLHPGGGGGHTSQWGGHTSQWGGHTSQWGGHTSQWGGHTSQWQTLMR
jgi:hypothetical protein